ncbi:diaminopimelate epimerase [Nocardioides marmotae]|uniref:diaminopimelate epimerase n=1 Tax=Nocardioides marmotae TaxID=2663857 RepID=UPI0012B64B4E|nr:diaminopimelate epimerase [Nocardioides marmotae]MBC9734391.1 diaminopimelate epimerase [Nocardioides marmotae]MTB85491.1 diaminopimelate epimerase [Nocardioides marmotae]
MPYPFLKGHGTENDFVLLPDHDGTLHGDLDPARVARLCDRRAGIGGDGVLRVVRTAAYAAAREHVDPAEAEWFMDYRNSDGSLSEMCGNGVRVFARHLLEEGLVEPGRPIPVGTRAGVKVIEVEGDRITVDMGRPGLHGATEVAVGATRWPAAHVDMGNPHAVAFLAEGQTLAADGPVGSLTAEPAYDQAVYPHGVNVEFVERRGPGHVAMRVHERGSGETRSCGTGACAVAVAVALADGRGPGAAVDDGAGGAGPATYRVDLPGGTLEITWTAEDRVLMSGPAVVVARGTTAL